MWGEQVDLQHPALGRHAEPYRDHRSDIRKTQRLHQFAVEFDGRPLEPRVSLPMFPPMFPLTPTCICIVYFYLIFGPLVVIIKQIVKTCCCCCCCCRKTRGLAVDKARKVFLKYFRSRFCVTFRKWDFNLNKPLPLKVTPTINRYTSEQFFTIWSASLRIILVIYIAYDTTWKRCCWWW